MIGRHFWDSLQKTAASAVLVFCLWLFFWACSDTESHLGRKWGWFLHNHQWGTEDLHPKALEKLILPATMQVTLETDPSTVKPLDDCIPGRHLKKIKKIFFFYFCLCWVFVAVCRHSLAEARGNYSLWWCVGFLLQWLLLLWGTGCRAQAQ